MLVSVRLLFSHFLNQCADVGLRACGDEIIFVDGEWVCVLAVCRGAGGGEGRNVPMVNVEWFGEAAKSLHG